MVASDGPPEEAIAQIIEMGFDRNQAVSALKYSDNNVPKAMEYIFGKDLGESISQGEDEDNWEEDSKAMSTSMTFQGLEPESSTKDIQANPSDITASVHMPSGSNPSSFASPLMSSNFHESRGSLGPAHESVVSQSLSSPNNRRRLPSSTSVTIPAKNSRHPASSYNQSTISMSATNSNPVDFSAPSLPARHAANRKPPPPPPPPPVSSASPEPVLEHKAIPPPAYMDEPSAPLTVHGPEPAPAETSTTALPPSLPPSIGLDHGSKDAPQIPPSSRKRWNEPPLLLPTNRSYIVPNLLTILHEIPLIRKEFLLNGLQLMSDYGFARGWWNGEVIALPSYPSAETCQVPYNDWRFLAELQRLMAFLDGESNRLYASIENLIQCVGDAKFSKSNDVEGFLSLYSAIHDRFDESRGIQKSRARSLFSSLATASDPAEPNAKPEDFFCIDLTVTKELLQTDGTLYAALNELIWGVYGDAYIDNISEVLTFRIKQDSGRSGAGIILPARWYPDRYTKEFKAIMAKNREEKEQLGEELKLLLAEKGRLTSYKGHDTVQLLRDTVVSLKSRISRQPDGDEQQDSETGVNKPEELIAQLKAVTRDIDSKVANLDNSINEKKLAFANASDFLTRLPPDPENYPPFHRYDLVGVLIDARVYMLRKRSKIQKSQPSQTTSSSDGTYKWWLIEYTGWGNETCRNFQVREITENEVVFIARIEGQQVTAIYGSENACNEKLHVQNLPQPLADFMALDREDFIRELELEEEEDEEVDENNDGSQAKDSASREADNESLENLSVTATMHSGSGSDDDDDDEEEDVGGAISGQENARDAAAISKMYGGTSENISEGDLPAHVEYASKLSSNNPFASQSSTSHNPFRRAPLDLKRASSRLTESMASSRQQSFAPTPARNSPTQETISVSVQSVSSTFSEGKNEDQPSKHKLSK